MNDEIRYLSERDVMATLDMKTSIDALGKMFVSQGRKEAVNLPKALATWGEGSSMHALGSVMTSGGYCGFKTWVKTSTGGGSLFTLFDSVHGTLLALIEARALGMLRTAATAGLATKMLAPDESPDVALIGAGQQAYSQLAALAAVRDIKRVRVFSRSAETCQEFLSKTRPRFDFEIEAAGTIEEALEGAQLVTTISRAREGFITRENLLSCRHLNAMGAILPGHSELLCDVLPAANLVVVDDIDNAKRNSAELKAQFDQIANGWEAVQTLAAVLCSDYERPNHSSFTVFKGMGSGLSDLALASVAYERSREMGLGSKLPKQTREELLVI